MPRQDTSLDDIARSITDLGTMIANQVDSTKSELSGNIGKLETKMDQGFEEVKGSLKALENDVKAIYTMLSGVQKDTKALRKTDEKLDRRLINLEQFAEKLSLKTGIPFEP